MTAEPARQRSAKIAAFVRAHDGTRPIDKVLLANNGIAAVKAMRSLRQWSFEQFGNEREIAFVAMATPEDLAANAEYIRMADHFVPVAAAAAAAAAAGDGRRAAAVADARALLPTGIL